MSRMYGAQSLRRKIKRMPDDVKGEVQAAIKDSADTIYYEALPRIPRDEGRLAEALHKRLSSDKLGAQVGYWKRGNLRNWRKAGWRAHFIEFGTRDQRARPFLGPAFNVSKAWIKSRINKAIDVALRKTING